MARQFHRPARLDPEAAEQIEGSTDTAVASELAHRAAQALIGGFPGTETEDDPITRSGIVSRVGHDLPLTRISDIQLDKDVADRFFGCGTLALQTSADDPLLLHDVPHVETVQVEISNLIFNDTQGAIDADPRS